MIANNIHECFYGEIKKTICHYLGPVIQSIISLTSLLVVKMLTVLVSTISNTQVFLLKKATHIFSAKKI